MREAVADAVGDEREILVEMHGRFTPAVAIGVANDLERFRPAWIEEPVPPENLKALAKVSERANIPAATGERTTPGALRVRRHQGAIIALTRKLAIELAPGACASTRSARAS